MHWTEIKPAKPYWSFAALAIVGGFLFLGNLGSGYLWQDEANTAVLARTVLTHGVPTGYDGKNYFSQELGAEYGPSYVWRWHTWLPFYVLAGFFAVLGESTFVARLPFALFGLATVFLTIALSRRLFANSRAAWLAAAALGLSVPFLLLARQCRYYPMAAFFFCWGLYTYLSVLDKKPRAILWWVVSSTLLFHSLYCYWVILLLTVAAHVMIFERVAWKRVARAIGFTTLINLPWIGWFATMPYLRAYRPGLIHLPTAIQFAGRFIGDFAYFIWKPYLWILLLVVFAVHHFKPKKIEGSSPEHESMGLLIIALFMHLAVLSLTASAPFFRFLAPAIPIASLLMGWLIDKSWTLDKRLGGAAVVALVLSQPLPDFFYELTHRYTGPVEGMVAFLNQNAKSDDIVAITYDDLPLKFYTRLRIVGGLTGEDLTPVQRANWVIWRKHIICSKDAAVARYISQHLSKENYRPIVLSSPDIEFQNSETLGLHHFRTVTNESPVVVYQKIR